MDFRGRTAVVTGGGSGIGRALVLRWASEGMNVVVADIEESAAARVAEEASALGAKAIPVGCDVSDFASVDRLAEQTYAEFGEANLLCSNAGVVLTRPLIDSVAQDWAWVFGVNLYGVVHGVNAFLPRMLAQPGPAHIVNTASAAGVAGGPARDPRFGSPGGTQVGVYAVSKHAVVAYTEQLYNAVTPLGIRVSLFCPGGVATRIADAERNRPADRGAPSSLPEARMVLAEQTELGMDPALVAEIARDGIRRGLFYIFTHHQTRDRVLYRFGTMIEDFAFARPQQP